MSNYPSPYQPPTPPPQFPQTPNFDYYAPAGAADGLAPARRAGVLMFVLAAVMLIGGVCCVGTGAMVPQLLTQHPEMADAFQHVPEFTPDLLKWIMVVAGAMGLLLGAAMVLLGVFVRRASKPAIIISIVLSILAMLYLLINVVSGFAGVGRMQAGQAGVGLCSLAIPLGLFGLLLTWLFQALKSADYARTMQDRYAQQYWQYAYHQQMYQQQQQQQQPQPPPIPPPYPQQQPQPPPPPPPPENRDAPPPQG